MSDLTTFGENSGMVGGYWGDWYVYMLQEYSTGNRNESCIGLQSVDIYISVFYQFPVRAARSVPRRLIPAQS
jgi:hypothetical protein